MLDENGKPIFMPGPERIPRTHGRREVYLNNQNIGDIGAKLVGNELKSTTDAQSLWLYGNGITAKGAEELAKGLKANTTLKVPFCCDMSCLSLVSVFIIAWSEAVLVFVQTP